jgi:hypothetical protein
MLAKSKRLIEYLADLDGSDIVGIGDKQLLYLCLAPTRQAIRGRS